METTGGCSRQPIALRIVLPGGRSEDGCSSGWDEALIFRSADLDRPFSSHNEELVSMPGTQLDAELELKNVRCDVGERVRQTLMRSMAGKRPTLGEVARELGMSSRTLQRRLSASRVTFHELLEAARRERAYEHLKRPAIEFAEAAFLLGFEDVNSFFRAFQAWEGRSPTEWRARHGKAGA